MPDPIQDTITKSELCEGIGIAFTYTISMRSTRTWYSEIVVFRFTQYAVRTIVCAVVASISHIDFLKKAKKLLIVILR